MEVRPQSFDTNDKKVKYIADHLITLQNILSADEALSTMLVDMINRAMYGTETPSIAPHGINPTPREESNNKIEGLSLPPRPDE
ncbi:MAG: hypothetical protein CMM25_07350 [Rhodospirillaceae bacterium]|nr:hypothetical protein [Rhodospirillaceae bacterium]